MSIDPLIKQTNLYLSNNPNDSILAVSILAQKILDDIVQVIKPGVSESEVTDAAHRIFSDYGIDKLWHRPHIRFNQNTLCSFKERPEIDYVLQDEDIAFVDIGIVKDGIEGDVGKTIVFGNNQDFLHLKDVSEILFAAAIQFWRETNPSGVELYEFIVAEAAKHHVEFNLKPAGHLIGAFPHTHGWTKGANTYPEKLSAYGWIVEIQIKHRHLPFGAFYEGLLV